MPGVYPWGLPSGESIIGLLVRLFDLPPLKAPCQLFEPSTFRPWLVAFCPRSRLWKSLRTVADLKCLTFRTTTLSGSHTSNTNSMGSPTITASYQTRCEHLCVLTEKSIAAILRGVSRCHTASPATHPVIDRSCTSAPTEICPTPLLLSTECLCVCVYLCITVEQMCVCV
jgi:hypothetical protein